MKVALEMEESGLRITVIIVLAGCRKLTLIAPRLKNTGEQLSNF